ncbi:antibiotic biosynthesis monooxygenase [Photobacterium sp. BZF1]|uniref:antibiotic biosynthesis monooxygenase n=1 Tax=Photobacterium sp. BZF1 TaxID=1904457 RepID=UPI0016534DCB|nr:antibiotic biosynthesis monooxygenase [Photobacterium sp. BZF1]MBC7006147.1 antibiotic biosynthesis monooxygenase [Photobacterium sp. BZF1]
MPFITMLTLTEHHGDGKKLARLHIARRYVEEASENISGFLRGETMLSADDPAKVLVMCTWENKQAYQNWLDSPIRDKQTIDLLRLVSADATTASFESVHAVIK